MMALPWILLGVVVLLLLISEVLGRLQCVKENTVHQVLLKVFRAVLIKIIQLILFGLGMGRL